MWYFPRRSNSETVLNMSQARFYQTKSPKNRKAGSTYTVEIPLPVWMVKTFCSPKWIESMREKHSKKIKFVLKPENKPKEDDSKPKEDDDETKKEENLIFVATGKHKETMRNFGADLLERYNKMIGVIKNIVKE